MRTGFQHLLRAVAVGRLQRPIAEHFQHVEYQQAHRRVVLDHQHGFALLRLQRAVRVAGGRIRMRLLLVRRQVQTHFGALAGLAGDLHVAAGLAGETVDHRQAEAGALADGLGSEEGFEDAGQHFGVHAAAAVRDA